MNIYLTIFGKPRYLGLMKMKDDYVPNHNKHIMLKTSRGYEMGIMGGLLNHEQEERYRKDATHYEDATEEILQDVEFIREADMYDMEDYYLCKHEEEEVLFKSRLILSEHKIPIKLVDVEYMLDRKKLYFYFTAEQRVDFRAYVRDLAHEFRTRIEMRQVGFRDEARIVQGLGSCGRPCCCSYWLRGFSPISIKIVKEQRSALNPTKISGLCGRLMCCMSYEKEIYSEMWAKLPGPGTKIRTEQGNYVLESLDVGHEHVNIRFPSGRLIPVKISEFNDFKETVLKGEEWGEDKELAAKKKAAQERIERIERAKQARRKMKVNARPLKPTAEKSDSSPKAKPKAKVKKQKQNQNQNQNQNREGQSKRRKPKAKSKQGLKQEAQQGLKQEAKQEIKKEG